MRVWVKQILLLLTGGEIALRNTSAGKLLTNRKLFRRFQIYFPLYLIRYQRVQRELTGGEMALRNTLAGKLLTNRKLF